ncbi:kelch-like protein 33 isoform X1 [Latimeria chalumnae]|uniref:kelch-like protein 33 isoform X1 n=1 Tax=Latimeria chalumnae TaxID=7897 RepID=UPI00313B91FA
MTSPVDLKENAEELELKTYLSENYFSEFFNVLEGMKKDDLLTDFCFTLNKRRFEFHAVVVSAVSSLVLKQYREGQGGEICLDGRVTKGGLEAILQYAYSGEIDLTKETVVEVKQAAEFLGVSRMTEICCLFQLSAEKFAEWQTPSSERRQSNLQSIRGLWEKEVGWDVQLEVDGSIFCVHRVILAAGSDYFRGMFTSGMKESTESVVQIFSIPAKQMGNLISFIYSGILHLGWENIFELTCISMQLQIGGAILLCFDFFQKEIDSETCLDIMAFAEAYNFKDLKDFVDDFILRNFQEVASMPKFQDLTLDQVSYYLSQDSLCTSNELDVFRIAVKWISADKGQRMSQAKKLMECIRFPLMTFSQFKEVRSVNLKFMQEGCQDLYQSALQEFGWTSGGTQQYFRVRLPNRVLVMVGGDQLSEKSGQRVPSKDILFANSFKRGIGLVKQIDWCQLSSLPGPARFRHGVTVLDNILYIFGGSHFHGVHDILRSVLSYDPMHNTWQQLADMNETRYYFSVVCRGRLIYVLGGQTDSESNLESVECYNPETNSWRFVHPLDQALCGHAAVVWNGEFYISGGFDCRYQCLVSMFHYDPEKGTTYLSNMNKDRAEHVMETIKDKMYVAGGIQNSGSMSSCGFSKGLSAFMSMTSSTVFLASSSAATFHWIPGNSLCEY